MSFINSAIKRIKGIIVTPKNEWETIASEEKSLFSVFMNFLLPLSIIAAVASMIGYTIIGAENPLGKIVGPGWGVRYATLTFINYIIGTFLTAFVISFFAPSFNADKSFSKAFKLVVYSYTPILVASVLFIIPALGTLVLFAGLYSLYLLYVGLRPMTNVPKDKQMTFFIVSIVVLIIVYFIVSLIFTKIIF